MMKPLLPRPRETALAAAFADLAESLVAERDMAATLSALCRHCVELVEVSAAGVLLSTEDGQWQVAAASSEPVRRVLDVLQASDGAWWESVRTSTRTIFSDLAVAEPPWGRAVAELRRQGFASAYALPMRLREASFGMLALFDMRTGSLSSADLGIGQALADAVAAGVVQHRELHEADCRVSQLQGALESRVVIEQAKGVLSQRGGMSIDQAFGALRRYARAHHLPLHQLAGQLVNDGRLADEVLGYGGR